jgi:hypothetical protein
MKTICESAKAMQLKQLGLANPQRWALLQAQY